MYGTRTESSALTKARKMNNKNNFISNNIYAADRMATFFEPSKDSAAAPAEAQTPIQTTTSCKRQVQYQNQQKPAQENAAPELTTLSFELERV